MRPWGAAVAGGLVVTLLATGCGGDEGADEGGGDERRSERRVGVDVPEGFTVTEVVDGLVGPTQLVVEEGGTWVVAHLNGPEGGASGQVLRIDPDQPTADPDVLFDGLTSPTGVAVLGDEIWVMEQRRLSQGPLTGGSLTTVLDELPYNGRSEGTLTATPEGTLLYDTSGAIDGDAAAEGSGTLWELIPEEEPEPYATGFKHAYARTFDADGALWEVEVDDGLYDGETSPDELVTVERGDDHGWPACVGANRPIELYGGTEATCSAQPEAHARFEAGATPTSVVVAPWDDDVLLVALWAEERVVEVPRLATGALPVATTTFLSGVGNPQHLTVDGNGVLLTDFDAGRILSVAPTR